MTDAQAKAITAAILLAAPPDSIAHETITRQARRDKDKDWQEWRNSDADPEEIDHLRGQSTHNGYYQHLAARRLAKLLVEDLPIGNTPTIPPPPPRTNDRPTRTRPPSMASRPSRLPRRPPRRSTTHRHRTRRRRRQPTPSIPTHPPRPRPSRRHQHQRIHRTRRPLSRSTRRHRRPTTPRPPTRQPPMMAPPTRRFGGETAGGGHLGVFAVSP